MLVMMVSENGVRISVPSTRVSREHIYRKRRKSLGIKKLGVFVCVCFLFSIVREASAGG